MSEKANDVSNALRGALTCRAEIVSKNGSDDSNKGISFKLTHAGDNRNWDFIAEDELRAAAPTAVGKKIDMQHERDWRGIVGRITDSKFVAKDGSESAHVFCDGEIWMKYEWARLAADLVEKGMFAWVSLEADLTEAECSVCGKKFTSWDGACSHIQNFYLKNKLLKGKPVLRIMHGVTITGVGLLDRPGADPKADITALAALQHFQEEDGMPTEEEIKKLEEEKKKAEEEAARAAQAAAEEEAAKKAKAAEEEEAARAAKAAADEEAAKLAEAASEEEAAKKAQAAAEDPGQSGNGGSSSSGGGSLSEAKAQIEKLMAENASMKAKIRDTEAKLLVSEMKRRGWRFADPAAEQAKVNELCALSDEAFAAAQALALSAPLQTVYADAKKSGDEFLEVTSAVRPDAVSDAIVEGVCEEVKTANEVIAKSYKSRVEATRRGQNK